MLLAAAAWLRPVPNHDAPSTAQRCPCCSAATNLPTFVAYVPKVVIRLPLGMPVMAAQLHDHCRFSTWHLAGTVGTVDPMEMTDRLTRHHAIATTPAAGRTARLTDTGPTPDPNSVQAGLHRAIRHAAIAGASWTWITGVLVGCLLEETTTTAARTAAIETLRRRGDQPTPSAGGVSACRAALRRRANSAISSPSENSVISLGRPWASLARSIASTAARDPSATSAASSASRSRRATYAAQSPLIVGHASVSSGSGFIAAPRRMRAAEPGFHRNARSIPLSVFLLSPPGWRALSACLNVDPPTPPA